MQILGEAAEIPVQTAEKVPQGSGADAWRGSARFGAGTLLSSGKFPCKYLLRFRNVLVQIQYLARFRRVRVIFGEVLEGYCADTCPVEVKEGPDATY